MHWFLFIMSRSDRITVQEREKMELDQERREEEKKKANEERTRTSRKVSMVDAQRKQRN